jgi:hypothetical protein
MNACVYNSHGDARNVHVLRFTVVFSVPMDTHERIHECTCLHVSALCKWPARPRVQFKKNVFSVHTQMHAFINLSPCN